MPAADTNVIVRILVRDDAIQAAAADAFIRRGAWVSVLALAETMWVLETYYARSRDEIRSATRMLLEHRDVVLQDADVVEAALDLFRARSSLGLSDCLMLALARKEGHLPLATFDRALAKVEGTLKL